MKNIDTKAIELAQHCQDELNLNEAQLSETYYYKSLPLCIIDAVFSIGINYTATKNVVINFCRQSNISRLRTHGSQYPDESDQLSVNALLDLYENVGIDNMTNDYYRNRCRTSTRNGLLKSEAVKLFCEALQHHKVNYFQDLDAIIANQDFEQEIKTIPGQDSGISTAYFYMLAGRDDFIKTDRMIVRFVESCFDEPRLTTEETRQYVVGAHHLLIKDFPLLTLRCLDHAIWSHQRNI